MSRHKRQLLPGQLTGGPIKWTRRCVAWVGGLMACVLAWFSTPTVALDIEFSGRTVRREILALYDSQHEKTPQTTRIHHFAEMPLNWLGYKVTYLDVNAILPDPAELARLGSLFRQRSSAFKTIVMASGS